MGERSTEAVRQCTDLVIGNDDPAAVVAAAEEGRRSYANIRRFRLYALYGGIADPAGAGQPLLGALLPPVPAQILCLMLTHSFAGAALGSEPMKSGMKSRQPRDPLDGVLGGGP